jgi:hypothetical protein
LTDEERSAWLLAAQSADAGDAWVAYKRKMADLRPALTGWEL